MAVIHKGKAVPFGITNTKGSGITYTLGATAGTAFKVALTGQDLSKDASLEEHIDPATGEPFALTFYNPTSEQSLKCFPYEASVTLAQGDTAGDANILPSIGDQMTLIDTLDPDMAGTTYVVIKCGKSKVNNGRVNFDVTVKKWAQDVSATVS